MYNLGSFRVYMITGSWIPEIYETRIELLIGEWLSSNNVECSKILQDQISPNNNFNVSDGQFDTSVN